MDTGQCSHLFTLHESFALALVACFFRQTRALLRISRVTICVNYPKQACREIDWPFHLQPRLGKTQHKHLLVLGSPAKNQQGDGPYDMFRLSICTMKETDTSEQFALFHVYSGPSARLIKSPRFSDPGERGGPPTRSSWRWPIVSLFLPMRNLAVPYLFRTVSKT